MCVNDDIGLLIYGFEIPPVVMMPYNPSYYACLVESHGFRKAMDLYAYYGETPDGSIPERVVRGVDVSRRRYNYSVRSLRMADFDAEAKRIQAVYNAAWQENWGALPMNDREFTHLAQNLKQIMDPELCLIAEVGAEVAGFSLALPDINQVLKRLDGRLFPFGLLKLLYYKRKIDAARILTMGVIKKFRRMGIDYCLYYETYRRAIARGIRKGEMSWVLETNTVMNGALQKLGFKVYKVYRLYDLPLQ
jgi:ribosomal protein S18 acetylase RimI-like enzyme